jgi:sugar (pentulose or hexulose) kinase
VPAAERPRSPAERPRSPSVLGIDLGTTEAKAALVGLDGWLLGLGRCGYPTATGPDGRAEQDPRAWWAAVSAAVRSIDAPGAEVLSVCGVGQGPTLTVLGPDVEPVRPAITWQDRRPASGGFGLLPRMAWLAGAEPASVAGARWLLSAWDALGLWLSGRGAMALQGHETALDADALRDAGVPPERVGEPLAVGAALGSLRPAAARALGLTTGIPVIAGVNDGIASVLGAGLLAPGDAVDTGGTSGGIAICSGRPVSLPGVYSAPSPLAGRWIVGGAMAATGAALDWLRGQVLGGEPTMDALLEEAAAVGPGADGLLFLPYLAGERAPVFDDAARGAFVGLTLAHGRRHLARAVLEAAAFALRDVASPVLAEGVPLTQLRLTGRPSPGDLGARSRADVLGVPVAIPAVGETAALGAAILAAAGVGATTTLEAAVRAMTSIARRVDPDPVAGRRYDELFELYRGLYRALATTMHALSESSAAG